MPLLHTGPKSGYRTARPGQERGKGKTLHDIMKEMYVNGNFKNNLICGLFILKCEIAEYILCNLVISLHMSYHVYKIMHN